MAQSNNIVYDDITGPFKRAYDAEQKFMSKVPSPKKKVDTSYHDEMVKEATESFSKPEAKKSSSNPKLGQKKKSKRKAGAKKVAAKKGY